MQEKFREYKHNANKQKEAECMENCGRAKWQVKPCQSRA